MIFYTSLQNKKNQVTIHSAFHNNYEQVSNTLISFNEEVISKISGGKMEKTTSKKNAPKENVYFPHI